MFFQTQRVGGRRGSSALARHPATLVTLAAHRLGGHHVLWRPNRAGAVFEKALPDVAKRAVAELVDKSQPGALELPRDTAGGGSLRVDEACLLEKF